MTTKNKGGRPPKPVIDPEVVMGEERAEKILVAMNPFTVARTEFTAWYVGTIGVEPEWTQPPVNWMFNAWIAAQGEREWLTDADVVKQEKLRERMEKIVAARKLNKEKDEIARQIAAKERKRVSARVKA